MAVFSSLRLFGNAINRTSIFAKLLTKQQPPKNALQLRQMSGHDRHMVIEPTRFQWHKFKDLFHYYLMVGLIPITGIILYTNIFIGPATLTEIPENYTPKHWEYYRHPITRFLSRYVYHPTQQEYEKMCHAVAEESEKAKIRLLEKKIKNVMAQNQDYEAYYYKPVTAKYHRYTKKIAEDQKRDLLGD